MGKSKIEWTTYTWNPLRGCTVVSPGCTNCYAMRMAGRLDYPGGPYEDLTAPSKAGPVWSGAVRMAPPEVLRAPTRWRQPRRVFVNSMSDLFHELAGNNFLDTVFGVMEVTPQHSYQVLTKRPARMLTYTSGRARTPLPNVWLGVSVEDQRRADERIPLLLATPAAVRWISAEPLLGPVNLSRWLEPGGCDTDLGIGNPGLDWVVVGGESGPAARPCDMAWVRDVVAQCKAAGVPVFVKQLGAKPVSDHRTRHAGENSFYLFADRKGGQPAEWPADLRVREYPRGLD